jgi:3-oxoacyl-[acyl-carrier-protein] synthase I
LTESVVLESGKVYCALGSLEETADALLRGCCALQPGPAFDLPVAHAPFPDLKMRHLDTALDRLSVSMKSRLETLPPHETLFVYCCAKGDLRAFDPSNERSDVPVSPLLDDQARYAARRLGLSPARTMVVSSACASGAVGLETAKELLETGTFNHAVLFGFDVQSRFVVSGFHSLNALSPEGARPFDKTRNGLTLGDGAALALLSFRKPQPGECFIAGAASSNDANHRTGPSRTGDGLYRAAAAALADAGIGPSEISAVKCHGTATAYNDAMEAKAIYRLFSSDTIPCFSLKGAIGHTSGAGSLIEVLLSDAFLKRRAAPPTAGYQEHGIDEPLHITRSATKLQGDCILCLSAGFGGLNAAIVLRESA